MNGPSPAPNPRRWLALALLGTAFFMVILDSTIVYVALPLIQEDLGFSTGGVQWVMSAYLICFGALLLLGGRAADLLGRRRVFMVGVALFAASSLLCGLAWSGAVLIVARVVQGASAAIMAPTALSLLLTVFPDGRDRNKALGIWGGLGGIGATAGLLIGGPVTEGLGWEWVFFINVPVALAVLLLTPRLLPESFDQDCVHCFDLAGALTVTTAVLLLVAGISEAPDAGWTDPRTFGFLGVSVVLLALFRRIEQRSPGPLVPLRIFRSRSLIGGNVVLLTAGMCIEGMLLIVTLYAQEVLGYSTIQFGLMTAVMTVMSVIGAYSAQATIGRIGSRPVGAAGMLLIGVACLLLTQVSADGSYLEDIFLGLLIFGAGLGAAFVASQIAALTGVAERESGLAAGLVDSSFNIGGALGLAILSTVAVARSDAVARGASPDVGLRAVAEGFQAAFLVAVGFGLVGLLAALALLPRSTDEEAPPVTQREVEPDRVE
jgi:EmrB/QacA subfamily drug resistance transporter